MVEESIDFKSFNCNNCVLSKNRKKIVIPEGDLSNARFLFIGEGPGADEDLLGRPFIGRSGKLLRELIKKAGIEDNDMVITNTVWCRPPNNRTPNKNEIEACKPNVLKVIDNMPNLKLIVLVGSTALEAILKLKKITGKRGVIFERDGKKYLPVLHPSAVLRNPSLKFLLERDLNYAKEYVNNEITYGKYYLVNTKDKFNILYDYLNNHEYISIDIETSKESDDLSKISKFYEDDDKIIGISFSVKEKEGFYLPLLDKGEEVFDKSIKEFIVDKLKILLRQKKLILHNGKFDIPFLKHKLNIDLLNSINKNGKLSFPFYFDTLIAHALLYPHERARGLKVISRIYSDLTFYESELATYKKTHKIKSYGDIPLDIIYKYGAIDADATFRLFRKFENELKDNGMYNLFHKIYMPLANILTITEYRGVLIDQDVIESIKINLENIIKEEESKIYKIAGKEFNINSRKQLSDVLFKDLKLKTNLKTKTGQYATSEAALKEINHEIVEHLNNYYKAQKLYSTYLTIPKDKNNIVHTSYNLHTVLTGRLSSSNPNLQNIPAKDAYRSMFISRNGYSFIISDYSQIELRVIAAFSKDKLMIETFNNGGDIHAAVARQMFNINPDKDVPKEIRRIAKTINFGIIYGMSSKGLAERAEITLAEAEKFLNIYFSKYKGVLEFKKRMVEYAKKNGYVKTLLGKKITLPDLNSSDKSIIMHAERQAVNFPIQGSAAECTNSSAIKLYYLFKKYNIDAHLVLTIHDELVYEINNKQLALALLLIRDTMRSTAEEFLKLPVVVDQVINNKWVEFKLDATEPEKLNEERKKQRDYIKSASNSVLAYKILLGEVDVSFNKLLTYYDMLKNKIISIADIPDIYGALVLDLLNSEDGKFINKT